MERTVIKASEGMILTNGEIFGREIYLAEGMDADAFTEITEEQYAEIMAEDDPLAEDAATSADYCAALREFGVNV
jgi:hypothetical protein